MDIQSTLLSRLQPAQAKPVELKNWLVGKLLSASVVERRPGNSLLLKVQDQFIEARSQQPVTVRPGENLTLKVIQNGNPAILKLVQQNPATNTQLQQQLLRESLPRQSGLEKMNAVLQQVQTRAQGAVEALPTPVKNQLQKLIDTLPTPKTLNSGQSVKTAIKDSGLFLEAKLLQQAKPQLPADVRAQIPSQSLPALPGADIKANLLQLARIIRQAQPPAATPAQTTPTVKTSPAPAPAPALQGASLAVDNNTAIATHKNPITSVKPVTTAPVAPSAKQSAPVQLVINQLDMEQLGKQVEAALARVETNQARAIVTDSQPLAAWNVEIPVKDKDQLDVIKLDLEQRKQDAEDSDEQGTWGMNLRVEFESGGSLSARVSMFDTEMNVSIWSHEQEISALIATHMDLLNKQFEHKGLELNQIQHIQSPTEQTEELPALNLVNITL